MEAQLLKALRYFLHFGQRCGPSFRSPGFKGEHIPQRKSAVSANHFATEFSTVNIFEHPELREALKVYSNWPTYPQLYVGGELIGGSDIVMEMFNSGELKQVIDAAVAAE